jgi:uncharacterized protein (TIGR02453 family)
MSVNYSGFPQHTAQILINLRANNSRDWFAAHREEYQRSYVAAAATFVEVAGAMLRQWRPGIRAEPKILGSIFRINRDPRARHAGGPYKDHIDFWFWEGERRAASSGYFLRLAPEFVGIGAGRHGFDRDQLRLLRGIVDQSDSDLRELLSIVDVVENKGYEIGGGPAGASSIGATPEGAARRLRRHRGLFVHHDEPAAVAMNGPALLSACERVWSDLTPLHAWLVDHLQA